jgi:NAD(P)-dependent dehydrogenase (short-subunit alcohol dehydrogenase family)
MNRLKNKVSLVTGAASVVGRATAIRFALEGAQVTVVDRHESRLAETLAAIKTVGGQAIAVTADVSSAAQAQQAIAEAVAVWGRLEIVFNGVEMDGLPWRDGPVDECAVESWLGIVAANLTSTFLVCKYSLPWMQRAKGGAIINLSSVLGLAEGGDEYASHAYAASKSGVIGLSLAMAAYYARHRIRVNVIASEVTAGLRDSNNPSGAPPTQEVNSKVAEPDDVAGAAAYLASDEARFVTGTVLTVDSGWTAG